MAREFRPISNTLATLAPPWWPELVFTRCFGSKCPYDSHMAVWIMKQGGMSLQGLIISLEEIIPYIVCQHPSCFNGKPWVGISGMSFYSPALYAIKACCWLTHHITPQQHALRLIVSYEYKTMPIEHINTNYTTDIEQ